MKSPEIILLEDVFGITIVEDESLTEYECSIIKDAMDTLTPRENQVINLKYYDNQDFRDIAKQLPRLKSGSNHQDGIGVTRERAWQIWRMAMRKLRHPSRSRILKDILTRIEKEVEPIERTT
jgi:DNA-directed RNA polymerase sigma subunit (sigma70/sigma32)